MSTQPIPFAFFGTPDLAVTVLNELEKAGFIPAVIITREDKPAGRKLILTPPPTKVWAEKRGIPVFQPRTLKTETMVDEINAYVPAGSSSFELFIVAAYGRIIPQVILDIPQKGSLNVHPSLLPHLRGPSPIESAILTEEETGISIMVLDAEMDHGPILAQEKMNVPADISEWPPYADELETVLAQKGGEMLARVIPEYISGECVGVEQDHSLATICKKITKEDALLDFTASSEINLRKIRAYAVWPRAHFFTEDGKRIIVTRAHIENNVLVLDKVIPEGKKEMSYSDFTKHTRN